MAPAPALCRQRNCVHILSRQRIPPTMTGRYAGHAGARDLPFLIPLFAVLALVTLIPELTTWLPRVLAITR
jgi:hypothetical protein